MVLALFALILLTFFSTFNTQPIEEIKKNVQIVEHERNFPVAFDDKMNTTLKTLIRVTRRDEDKPQLRKKRQLIEAIQTAGFVISFAKTVANTERGEQILDVAKTIAIVIIAVSTCCFLCCCSILILICAKCCCGKSSSKSIENRRNNAGLSQPVLVHVDSNFRNPRLVQSSEAQLMLTRPSAPIENNFHYQNEYPPPPYEKLYQQK